MAGVKAVVLSKPATITLVSQDLGLATRLDMHLLGIGGRS
jgi:hypothetical protein